MLDPIAHFKDSRFDYGCTYAQINYRVLIWTLPMQSGYFDLKVQHLTADGECKHTGSHWLFSGLAYESVIDGSWVKVCDPSGF